VGSATPTFPVRGRLQVSGSYTRACELAEKRGDTNQLAMAVYGLWLSVVGSGRISPAASCRAGCWDWSWVLRTTDCACRRITVPGQPVCSAANPQRRASTYELRAATSLARLWGEQGRTEARELLAPVYGWFTEGVDTADLKEAKGLLDKLT